MQCFLAPLSLKLGIKSVFQSTRGKALFVCHFRGLEWDGDSPWLLRRSCGKVNGKVQSCYRGNWERSAPLYARTSCLPKRIGNCCPPESLNSLCVQKSNNWVLSGRKEVLDLLVLHSGHDWLGLFLQFFVQFQAFPLYCLCSGEKIGKIYGAPSLKYPLNIVFK